MKIEFSVPGRPVPKGRPRVTRYNTYTPKSTVDYENRVRDAWQEQSGQAIDAEKPIRVDVAVHFEVPRSFSKKLRARLIGAYHIRQRGDLDNIVKSILDALNGHAFPDDCAVCVICASKDYAEIPSTDVTIRELE